VPLQDEVDLSPEEQFTRHRVEMDADKLHALHKMQGRFKVNPVSADYALLLN
jgi:hypothetical protein